MIKKFRKKPVVIEAMQWCGNNFQELEEFGSQRHIISNPDGTLTIDTSEGNHTAQKNDWIIRGVQGEVYPCKPDIFEANYEEVAETETQGGSDKEPINLVKELKSKTLERIIEKFGKGFGDLNDMKISIWDVREVLYSEARKIAEREFKEELEKW